MIVADVEGRLLFSNAAAERILGIGNVEVLPDTRMALEGWYLPDQVSVVPPDQLPLVRAIRGEKIIDELIFVRNSQPRPGILDPGKRVAPEGLCLTGFRRGRDIPRFHPGSQCPAKLRAAFSGCRTDCRQRRPHRHARHHPVRESSLRGHNRIRQG